MAELTDAAREIEALAGELRRLEAEYNMYFAGRASRPPWETRSRVEGLIRRLDRGYIQAPVDRFRLSTLQHRFATFTDLWDRGLRAREEGRPGPFNPLRSTAVGAGEGSPRDRLVHVTAFSDPMSETDKLHTLYESLMNARRETGGEALPFHRFATLVRSQVAELRRRGNAEVAFRVAVKDGKVSFTAKGLKGT